MNKTKTRETLRFLTASSLFDGHDTSINLVRRWLLNYGAEVIHLGHNRGVDELIQAATEECVDGIALTSYQGGHMDTFTYLIDKLKAEGLEHISVFGGGGGVISLKEATQLKNYGVLKIYRPEDGEKGGVETLVKDMLHKTYLNKSENHLKKNKQSHNFLLSHHLQSIAHGKEVLINNKYHNCPILGFTGTGGAGKSTLVDEVLRRFLQSHSTKKVAVLCIDPCRAATGGAMLGDRMRYNMSSSDRVFIHSIATEDNHLSISKYTKKMLKRLSQEKFDLVILETAGTGQSDYSIKLLCDISIYVMNSNFGAPTQLEKINMLDYADLVVLNKFDHPGSSDAMLDVAKAIYRCRKYCDDINLKSLVTACCADQYDDLGVNTLFNRLMTKLREKFPKLSIGHIQSLKEGMPALEKRVASHNYLNEIKNTVLRHHHHCDQQAKVAAKLQAINLTMDRMNKTSALSSHGLKALLQEKDTLYKQLSQETKASLKAYKKADKNDNRTTKTLSGLNMPKVMRPNYHNDEDIVRYLGLENKPGKFPFTSGLFPHKRSDESPTRMFAGEGSPEQTNARFHLLCQGQSSQRLSTAFDSCTLYGHDPTEPPDIQGKIGNSGVSICCLDDMKRLFSGFNLCAPDTSVSMTINGPAIIILAFYFNTAIDAEIERRFKRSGKWHSVEKKIKTWFKNRAIERPQYRTDLPEGHDGSGLGFLGLSSEVILGKDEVDKIRKEVLPQLRGTLQADIFKEEQAQNTCLYSREFSLDLMADIQQYFVKNNVEKYYSVSVSGYHIAEAGANPITELAFTLSNGFALVELYLSKGLKIDDFASNFSFFFSNGMDPEYSVIGRVARRIWAIAIKNYYKGNEHSQKLKYHIQTSGRSLHAQNSTFNDIRTTLEAFYATCDNCNSLHTNAFDEAISTPTETSVKQALAIQMILNQEYGLCKNDNPLQGSYIIEWLTHKVEETVLNEFHSLYQRGGVLGAMDYHYQRNKIQEEAMHYERGKSNGEVKIIGVNTFTGEKKLNDPKPMVRSSKKVKRQQIKEVKTLLKTWTKESEQVLKRLFKAKNKGKNLFPSILEASRYCSLEQISNCLMKMGGEYRRSM